MLSTAHVRGASSKPWYTEHFAVSVSRLALEANMQFQTDFTVRSSMCSEVKVIGKALTNLCTSKYTAKTVCD